MSEDWSDISGLIRKFWTLRDKAGVDHFYEDAKKRDRKAFGIIVCTGAPAYYTEFREHRRKVGGIKEDYEIFDYYVPEQEVDAEKSLGIVPENLCELCQRWELMQELSQ